jgi:hypothetical protein
VTSELPKREQNALWLFFSGQAKGFQFSDKHYHWSYPGNKGLLWQLYEKYLNEGIVMPYTLEDFHREYTEPYLKSLPPEVLLKELSPEERLKGLSPEVVFKQYQPEERLKGLSPNARLKGLSPDVRLKGLSPEMIEEYLSQLKKH